ncbi:TPA: hypothetical protein KMU55_000612 [Enterococcus faecium]|nr:hypothetical protein [Enterococcus faecium]HBE7949784.1 hypothetical protein [Enterococcus faecium]HBE7956221.1 hypothetical protein [Enterococcus faecium]HBE8063027.1 hypothetical protein [Enterococcus faecium]
MADLSALDEDREIRFVSPESSIGIAKIQKLIARSIFSSGMKRNFYRDQFLIFLKFIFLRLVSRKKRIISSQTVDKLLNLECCLQFFVLY